MPRGEGDIIRMADVRSVVAVGRVLTTVSKC